jgi:hypothetical protein
MDRWDIINYLRSLQGKISIPADTSHCRPGETGLCTPGASPMGPTHPSPFYHPGMTAAASAAPMAPADTSKKGAARPDTTKKAEDNQ